MPNLDDIIQDLKEKRDLYGNLPVSSSDIDLEYNIIEDLTIENVRDFHFDVGETLTDCGFHINNNDCIIWIHRNLPKFNDKLEKWLKEGDTCLLEDALNWFIDEKEEPDFANSKSLFQFLTDIINSKPKFKLMFWNLYIDLVSNEEIIKEINFVKQLKEE